MFFDFIRRIFRFFFTKFMALVYFFILNLALTISLIFYHPSDPSFNVSTPNNPSNALGYFGSFSSDLLYQTLGIISYIVISFCFLCCCFLLCKKKIYIFYRFLSLAIFSIFFSIILLKIEEKNLISHILPATLGGMLSFVSKYYFHNGTDSGALHINSIYIYIISVSCFFLTFLGVNFYKKFFRLIYVTFLAFIKYVTKFLAKRLKFNHLSKFLGEPYQLKNSFINLDNTESVEQVVPNLNYKKFFTKNSLSANKNQNSQKILLPEISLLESEFKQDVKSETESQLKEKAKNLILVLQDFGVMGKIIDVKQGPVVTLYEFEPVAGTKSSRVIGLSEDIARSLSIESSRIFIIPNKNALGIELPNENRIFFRQRELINSKEFYEKKLILPLILGKDISGKTFIVDLAQMPHLLIAGTTGSGKSVAINAMIMSLLFKYGPDECRMIMIDPKMLELSIYDNIPHLLTPVVTDAPKAVNVLKWAVKEMEHRYRKMSYLSVRNIENFNQKIQKAIEENTSLNHKIQTGFDQVTGEPIYENLSIELKTMPLIVIIVDEMADLMLVSGKEVEVSIQRLAQMARAAGIHIIMSTQRPSVDVITGVIKANFPSRISFKVTSKIDSRTILGEQGAEQLLGKGDMLYTGNGSKLIRVHAPFVGEKEVLKVTNFLKNSAQQNNQYLSECTISLEKELNSNEIENNIDDLKDKSTPEDKIYNKALSIIKNERKASISYIQRSLRIGYNRAANIIEQMENQGIVSPPGKYGKREVLLPEKN